MLVNKIFKKIEASKLRHGIERLFEIAGQSFKDNIFSAVFFEVDMSTVKLNVLNLMFKFYDTYVAHMRTFVSRFAIDWHNFVFEFFHYAKLVFHQLAYYYAATLVVTWNSKSWNNWSETFMSFWTLVQSIVTVRIALASWCYHLLLFGVHFVPVLPFGSSHFNFSACKIFQFIWQKQKRICW